MKKNWLAVGTGFALFSMFFGSGNLVFPITVGQESGGHYLLAACGILLTGVVVPFLGVFGMLLYRGEVSDFFRFFGKKGTFLFVFFALSLMGPFGVMARCLTVAHGAFLLLLPNVSLPITSAILCLAIYLLTVNQRKIVPLLGVVLTPFLLAAIAAIAFFGLTSKTIPMADISGSWQAFKNGFFQGYQTMDLLAAFFFSGFVLNHLAKVESANLLKTFCKAAIIGGGVLSLVYVALVVLGWIYAPLLIDKPPQEMLGVIAMQSLGSFAAPFVCAAVILACLTTAMVLAVLFADFIKDEMAQSKISRRSALVITLAIGFLVSTLEFAGITKFLGPILETIYPALILLTVVNIARRPGIKEENGQS